MKNTRQASHPVYIFAVDETVLLDIAGPAQVLESTNLILGRKAYKTSIVTPDGNPIRTDAGIFINADQSLSDEFESGTIIVTGGRLSSQIVDDIPILKNLVVAQSIMDRVASVCSGSMILAATGLLDGKRASCHWKRKEEVLTRFPDVDWRMENIYSEDGRFITSAGASTGIDMTIRLVEQDHGIDVAHAVSRELVVFMRRPGMHSQYSPVLQSQFASLPRIQELCTEIAGHPRRDWTVAEMADFAAMTERSLHRHFLRELALSPARYVEKVRVSIAASLVIQDNEPFDRIADRVGFRDSQRMRRAFTRVLGTSPTDLLRNCQLECGNQAIELVSTK